MIRELAGRPILSVTDGVATCRCACGDTFRIYMSSLYKARAKGRTVACATCSVPMRTEQGRRAWAAGFGKATVTR